ncbi:MAG: tetratricopeptide repeat protein [Chloroflexi bacterium]|nr:tetratricopeptide repeat protein [Chloroflexota bacterium]
MMNDTITLPDTFAAALRYLRKRSRLTQDELGRAVGYSREQIARLENGSRLPDLAVIAALFIPALHLERDRALLAQFLALAGQSRTDQQITITHSRKTRIQLLDETVTDAAATPEHTPPFPLLPLIGRTTELADLLTLLPSVRLITLLGAPGIGKTRLALELAHAALGQFAQGVAFISLAEISTPSDVPYAVLRCLGLTPAPQQGASETICAYLAPRQLLLVLDNCEHLLDAAALFATWLAQAPQVKLLCTSREPLDLYGEYEWPLAPLAVPNLAEPPDLRQWEQYPALQLLLARVYAVLPQFRLTADNLLPLATLCVVLDGLPLALELAAVRLRELSPEALVQQLLRQRRQGQLSSTWLRQTKRNIAQRHHTLQAAIAWSVNLLAPPLAETFYRLAVFVGGGTDAAAFAIIPTDVTALVHLARVNLIQYQAGRVFLLETIRAFAQEQLLAGEQWAATQHRHATYYADLAQQIFGGLQGEEQTVWMQRALAEHHNCLAALRWALAQGNGELAVAIASGLWWFWYRRGLFQLGTDLLAAALQLPTPHLLHQANALNGLASIYLAQDEYAASLACHTEGLFLRRQLGEASGIATVLHNMGLTAYCMGDYPQAITWLKESLAVDPTADPVLAWAHMGFFAQEMQDLAQARYWHELAYQRVAHGPDGWTRAFVLNNYADLLEEVGEFAAATALAQESVRLFTLLEDSYYLPDPQLVLARIALAQGDRTTGQALATLALQQYEARGDGNGVAAAMLVLAKGAILGGEKSQPATCSTAPKPYGRPSNAL